MKAIFRRKRILLKTKKSKVSCSELTLLQNNVQF